MLLADHFREARVYQFRTAIRNIAIATVLLGVSCKKLPKELGPTRAFTPPTGAEGDASRNLRWGLALSGGGLRAAAFEMGAMKALYDAGLMDSMQVISTVSGGSYATYWLMSRELRAPAGRRFAAAFDAPNWRAGSCELFTTSNFFTYWRYAAVIASTLTARGEYNSAILRTFGRVEYDTVKYWTKDSLIQVDSIQLHEFQAGIRERRLPHWIINSTVTEPRPVNGWSMGLYEMTPFTHGNASRGYSAWANDSSFPLRRAVAISSAAFKPALKQTVPLDSGFVTLADGGGSENLGAIALIRRRVKNIVIVDAELDPNYKIGAYTKLKKRLSRWGDTIVIESLDRYIKRPFFIQPRLKSAIHVGKVMAKDGSYAGNVYYVKMSVPVAMDSVLNDRRAFSAGRREHNRMVDVLEGTKTPAEPRWHCEALASESLDLKAFYRFQIALFAGREQRTHKVRFLSGDFPQYRTADQSFNINRTSAYLGLGYLVTLGLPAMIK